MRRGPARLSDASGSSGVVPGARPRPRVVPWTDGDTWQAFVDSAADGTIAHLWAWREVVRETYGHRTEYLAAVDGAVVRGVLPLVVVRSRLFGRHVISMPYLDYGGVCSGHDDDVDAVLVDAALALADEEGAVLQLRHRGRRPLDLPVSLEKAMLALVSCVSVGSVESIVVLGAVVSTVQLTVAGVASLLPAASVAWTVKV